MAAGGFADRLLACFRSAPWALRTGESSLLPCLADRFSMLRADNSPPLPPSPVLSPSNSVRGLDQLAQQLRVIRHSESAPASPSGGFHKPSAATQTLASPAELSAVPTEDSLDDPQLDPLHRMWARRMAAAQLIGDASSSATDLARQNQNDHAESSTSQAHDSHPSDPQPGILSTTRLAYAKADVAGKLVQPPCSRSSVLLAPPSPSCPPVSNPSFLRLAKTLLPRSSRDRGPKPEAATAQLQEDLPRKEASATKRGSIRTIWNRLTSPPATHQSLEQAHTPGESPRKPLGRVGSLVSRIGSLRRDSSALRSAPSAQGKRSHQIETKESAGSIADTVLQAPPTSSIEPSTSILTSTIETENTEHSRPTKGNPFSPQRQPDDVDFSASHLNQTPFQKAGPTLRELTNAEDGADPPQMLLLHDADVPQPRNASQQVVRRTLIFRDEGASKRQSVLTVLSHRNHIQRTSIVGDLPANLRDKIRRQSRLSATFDPGDQHLSIDDIVFPGISQPLSPGVAGGNRDRLLSSATNYTQDSYTGNAAWDDPPLPLPGVGHIEIAELSDGSIMWQVNQGLQSSNDGPFLSPELRSNGSQSPRCASRSGRCSYLPKRDSGPLATQLETEAEGRESGQPDMDATNDVSRSLPGRQAAKDSPARPNQSRNLEARPFDASRARGSSPGSPHELDLELGEEAPFEPAQRSSVKYGSSDEMPDTVPEKGATSVPEATDEARPAPASTYDTHLIWTTDEDVASMLESLSRGTDSAKFEIKFQQKSAMAHAGVAQESSDKAYRLLSPH